MKCRHHCRHGWVWHAEDDASPCPVHATVGQRAAHAYEEARYRLRMLRRRLAARRVADDFPF